MNGTEDPEINPHIFSQKKVPKYIGKGTAFSANSVGKLGINT
jgi:hypothetical protein